MARIPRRGFLKGAGTATLAAATANSWFSRVARAQTSSTTTRVVIDPSRQIAELDRRLFGSCLEHLGRAISTATYEPGSKFGDSNRFRTDVINDNRRLGVP